MADTLQGANGKYQSPRKHVTRYTVHAIELGRTRAPGSGIHVITCTVSHDVNLFWIQQGSCLLICAQREMHDSTFVKAADQRHRTISVLIWKRQLILAIWYAMCVCSAFVSVVWCTSAELCESGLVWLQFGVVCVFCNRCENCELVMWNFNISGVSQVALGHGGVIRVTSHNTSIPPPCTPLFPSHSSWPAWSHEGSSYPPEMADVTFHN